MYISILGCSLTPASWSWPISPAEWVNMIWKCYTYGHSVRYSVEQRAVIRFVILIGLTAKAIHSDLVSMHERDALVLSTVKKWHQCSSEGRRDFVDDRRSGTPLTHDLAEIIHSVLEGRPFASRTVLCRNFRIGKATCLRILHDSLGLKKFHPHKPERQTRRAKKYHIHAVFCSHWKKRNQRNLSTLSPATSCGSFCIIHAIYCEQSPEIHFLNESNKILA
jgi:hypothetical protein